MRGHVGDTPLGVACISNDELAKHAKRVVDGLPPLTDEQPDLLTLIFRTKPWHATHR
jgi:hypothetical protein